MVMFRSAAGTPNERAMRSVAVTMMVPSRFSIKKAPAAKRASARHETERPRLVMATVCRTPEGVHNVEPAGGPARAVHDVEPAAGPVRGRSEVRSEAKAFTNVRPEGVHKRKQFAATGSNWLQD